MVVSPTEGATRRVGRHGGRRHRAALLLSALSALAAASLGFVVKPAGASSAAPDAERAVPGHVATIYEYAAATAPCSLPWTTLAGVGAVTSDHTRVGGEVLMLPDGLIEPTILYRQWDPANPTGLLADTDGGAIDGDPEHDRTVGPMQFLPETWVDYGLDGNGDGILDPDNLWDAAVSAANRLCQAGVDTDPDRAITRYFGVDTYNEWVRGAAQEAATWQAAERPEPQSRVAEVISIVAPEADRGITADVGTNTDRSEVPAVGAVGAVEPEVAGAQQIPARDPQIAIGPLPSAAGRGVVPGDWDGNGAPGQAALVTEADRRLIRLTDDEGRPYGTVIDVSEHVGRPSSSPGLQVGEWDGDGIDDVALVVTTGDSTIAYRFDRAGQVIDELDLGALIPGATIAVGPAPAAALSLDDGAFWKTVTIHDGSTIDLWKVGGIIVEESMVGPASSLLAAAAADGVVLQGWGWRSHDAQIELRRAHCADVWTTPASQCSPPTAVPGTSRHETGSAIDFYAGTSAIDRNSEEFAWLTENAETHGFYNLPSEPWHWSVDGG